MEDDHQNLLPQYGFGGPQTRTSCNRGTAYAVFSILAALLLAGQAVTVYFVYQHETQISKLTKNIQDLTLDSLFSYISKNTNSNPNLKTLALANVMPMASSAPEFLAMENKLTNSTEDQVKRLLLLENPTRTFPVLQSNFQDNMDQLKTHMGYNDWKEFESWMHKWLIFQIAQKQNSVKTKCQQEECSKGIHLGKFCAQCDDEGNYLPTQCLSSSGFCWCVNKNGTKIAGTEIRGQQNCSDILDFENTIYSGGDQI